jgi:hypothetical protein
MAQRWCDTDKDYFDSSEFDIVDGDLIHRADPPHLAHGGGEPPPPTPLTVDGGETGD